MKTFILLLLLPLLALGQITNVVIGTSANDGTGDTLRGAFSKVNANVAWLASQLSTATNASTTFSNQVFGSTLTINGLSVATNATVSGAAIATKVNTVADLVAMVPTQDGMLVQTLGYYSAGDGGGATFRWVSGNSTSTNLGTSIKPSGATGRFLWVPEARSDIRMFGAKGDTSTDNTLSIQAALDYGAESGVTIYVPSADGQAFLTGALTLTNFVTIEGDNDPNALNTAETGVKSVIRRKSGDSVSAAVLTVPSGIQCSITGIAFDGDRFNNASNTNAVVDFQGSGTNYDKRSMRRVSVRYATGYGIKIGSAEAYLDNVVVLDGSGVGIYLRGQDNIWNNILVGRNAGDGIYIDNSSPFPSGAVRARSIDSYQNQGHGLYLIIPFTDIFDKIVCNNNNKCGVYMISDVSTASRNVFEKGEFVNNNFPDVVYATSRGTITTSSSPHASGTFANFYVTGTGAASANIWINSKFSLSESSNTKKPSFGFQWDIAGSPNGALNHFINCIASSVALSPGLITSPTNLWGNSSAFSYGSGDLALGAYSSSVNGALNVSGTVTASGNVSAATLNLSGALAGTTASFNSTAYASSGAVTNAWNVGNGSQSGSSTTPTLSVTHNTTVSSFLQSIISGQPTLRFRNLGSANMDISDMSNGRIGKTLVIASGRNDLILGGNAPGPAVDSYIRSPDSSSGTDNVGGNLYLNPGRGTGAGAPSTVVMQLPAALSSGTTQQSWSSAFAANGSLGFNLGIGGLTGTYMKRIRHGRATLAAGSVVVSDAHVTTSTRIILSVYVPGGTQGHLSTSTRVASTSFTISSTSGTETSVVDWIAIEP